MDIKSYLQVQVAERILVCDEKWNESIENSGICEWE